MPTSPHCVGVDRRRKTCFLNSVFSNFHIEEEIRTKQKHKKVRIIIIIRLYTISFIFKPVCVLSSTISVFYNSFVLPRHFSDKLIFIPSIYKKIFSSLFFIITPSVNWFFWFQVYIFFLCVSSLNRGENIARELSLFKIIK